MDFGASNGVFPRRAFLGSALGSVALLGSQAAFSAPAAKGAEIKLGVCSYSYGKMTLDEVIQATTSMNVRYINIKPELHLPYESTPAQLAEARKRLDDAGLTLGGTGTAYLLNNDEAEVRSRFEYNKHLRSPLMVTGTSEEVLPLIAKFAKEYDIKVAVHNHGPEDQHFQTPALVMRAVKNLDPHVGLCMDIGHTLRVGMDVLASTQGAGARLLDLHVKDVKRGPDGKWGNVNGAAVNMGDGEMPVAALFQMLMKIGYTGCCNLEYEVFSNFPDRGKQGTIAERLAGMRASLAYARGVIAGLKVV